jgi:copper resistance protein D
VGAVAGNLWILPAESVAESPTLVATRLRLWWLLGLCLLGFMLGGALELLLRTAGMSDLPLLDSFAEIGTVLFKTHYGRLWLWRSAALLIVMITWVLHRQKNLSRVMSIAALIALAVIAVTISASGHAGDDGILSAANIANSLHIIGALLWGGGILATTMCIFPVLVRGAPSARQLLAAVGTRLSTLAGLALVLVVFPGFYNAWLQIDSWHGLWGTTYGQVLTLKLILVAGMMALGALNRFFFVPGIQPFSFRRNPRILQFSRKVGAMLSGNRTFHSLRDSIRIEALLLLAVLILAAALSQQTPATHAEHENLQDHVHSDA